MERLTIATRGMLLLLLLCGATRLFAQPFFEDAGEAAGMTAPHEALIMPGPEVGYLTTGQAWGDYNGDGWLDLYVTNTLAPNVLYRNEGNGQFIKPGVSSQVTLFESLSGGAVFADYDNDGWADLYVLNLGKNILFHNNGGSGFSDVTDQAGVGDTARGQTASWGDYDGDGWLDLYVANWACEGCDTPDSFSGNRDRLYHNNGDGTFTDVTAALGFELTEGAGFVGSFVDYDNDGDLDIYTVNDQFRNPIGNILWRNDGPGGENGWLFADVSESSGANALIYGMGLAVGDYDSDGDLDFYCSNKGRPVLLQNQTAQGSPTFSDVAAVAGVDSNGISWGAFFCDYDNDSYADIFLANGDPMTGGGSANFLFRNTGGNLFEDVSLNSGVNHSGVTIGCAYADYDADGWMDMIIGNWNDSYKLYRNQGIAGAGNHWLAVNLRGAAPINRDAVGSRVYLYTSDGKTLMQEVKCGSSHGAGNQLALHFGLGSETIDSATVVWPNGVSVQFADVAHNQFWEVTYPGSDAFVSTISAGWNLVSLPRNVDDPHYLSVFPNAAPNTLFSYNGEYINETFLEAGKGYWLNFPAAETVQIPGALLNSVTLDLSEGWNIISGPSCGAAVGSISDPNNILVPGTVFGFDEGYVPSGMLEPGKGYWIKAAAGGQITISCE